MACMQVERQIAKILHPMNRAKIGIVLIARVATASRQYYQVLPINNRARIHETAP
jgi:hypothetical protein